METERTRQVLKELGRRVPELNENLTSFTFGFGCLGVISGTTRLKQGRGLFNKLFGKTLAKVEYIHCPGHTPSETIKIYDDSIEQDIVKAYSQASPAFKPRLDHGPGGKNPHNDIYHFSLDSEKYMKAFLSAGSKTFGM